MSKAEHRQRLRKKWRKAHAERIEAKKRLRSFRRRLLQDNTNLESIVVANIAKATLNVGIAMTSYARSIAHALLKFYGDRADRLSRRG